MDSTVYDRYVEGALERHWWSVARRKIVVDLIDRTIPLPRPADVLDVGCGTGAEMEAFQRYGNVWGVDTEIRMVELAPLIVSQTSISCGFSEALARRLGPRPAVADLFQICRR